jgi:hypothetical protein
MSQKYNGVSEKIDGFISNAVKVEAEQGRLLVTPDPKMIKIMEEGDFYNILIVAPVLKHYFSTNLENIKIDTDNVYCQIEIPEMFFTKEVRIVCKSGRPVEFRISNDPVTNPASQFVPEIIVVDDEAESTIPETEQGEPTSHEGLEDNREVRDEGDAG